MKLFSNLKLALSFGVVIFAVGLVWLSCDSPFNGGDWSAVVHGQVTDVGTGLPIDSADVFFNDTFNTFTDSTGTYSLIGGFGNPPDSIGCRMTGYAPQYLPINVVNGQRDYYGYDFQLLPIR